MYNDPYEQGGITGRPNSQAILDALGRPVSGGTAAGPVMPAAPGMPLPYTPPAAGDLSAGLMENHKSQAGALSGAASGASTGASVGSVIPVLGTLAGAGIGAGVGAIKGWAQGRTNNTSNEREQFAQGLGMPNTTALWERLNSGTTPEASQELQNRALNRIGKHDETANAQWMQDVQAALAAGKPPPPPPAAPEAPAAAGAPAATGGGEAGKYRGMLQGFDNAKFDDPNKHDPKYDFAHIAADYPPTPEGLAAMAQDPRFTAGGFKYLGGDKIQSPDGGMVDVGLSFGSGGGKGWAWQDPNGGQLQAGGAGMQQGGTVLPPELSGDPLAAIQAAIGKYSGQGANIKAILANLRGGQM